MLMIRPLRLRIITSDAARVNRNTLRRLVAMTASQSSSLIRGMSVSLVMPALLTTISSRPHFSARSSTSLLTAALSVTSHGCTSAVPPAAAIASAVSFSLSALRATQATFAPAPASRSAIALPMPREAPVTIAVWPLKINLNPPIGVVCHMLIPD